jgi:hypothetical protein
VRPCGAATATLGGSDVHLGDLTVPGVEKPIGFYMSESQFGFSVEAPEGVRFLILSRLFTDEEYAALEEA